MRTSIQEENRELVRTNYSSRSRPPVHAERETDALGRGGRVHLSINDWPRILVTVALLGRGNFGRSAGFAHAPSLGRPYLFRSGMEHVRHVGAADETHLLGISLVESGPQFHH